jgi:hypothetical protein
MIEAPVVVRSNTRKQVESLKLTLLPTVPKTPGGKRYVYPKVIETFVLVTPLKMVPSRLRPSIQLTAIPEL